MGRRPAFTLIELLVVMAVIALLIGILLPSLGKARERAFATRCLSNQRSIAQGAVMYAQDFRGHLPLSSHTTGNAFSPENWITTLVPYGVLPQARRCPVDPTNRTNSYVTNDYLEPLPVGGGWARIDLIPRPAAVGFALESEPTYGIDHTHAVLDGWSAATDMLGEIDARRHQDGMNVSFLDGHAAYLAWRDVQATFTAQRNFLNPAAAH